LAKAPKLNKAASRARQSNYPRINSFDALSGDEQFCFTVRSENADEASPYYEEPFFRKKCKFESRIEYFTT
jgi:hypothetical protein